MNILHFVPVYAPSWSYGGPVRSISMLAEEQARQGHRVAVLTTNAGLASSEVTVFDDWTVRNGVKVCYCRRDPGFGIRSSSLESRVDAVVGGFEVMHLSAIWHPVARAAHRAARRSGVPVIISPRGALGPYAWRRRRWLKKIYYALFEGAHFRGAAGFHYTSQSEAGESAPYTFGKPHCIVPNGIDENLWLRNEKAGFEWRSSEGFGTSDLLLLYAGRLHHKKGLEILPSALARLRPAFPGRRLRLLLVGPNEDGTLQELEAAVDRAGIPGSLKWIPTLPEVGLPAVYSAADIFLMPSLHENFGNSAIEALACGCVPLVSAETGCLEFGRECGMQSVSVRDPALWAAAILDILRRGRNQLGRNERERLMRRVGLRAAAAEVTRFYQASQNLDGRSSS